MFYLQTVLAFLKDKQYRDLLLTSVFLIAGGSVVYHYLEGWSWVDSAYFCVITLTTIGYGDYSPQTDAGKVFTMGYILIGLGMILSFINTVYHHYAMMKEEKDRNGKNNT